MKKPFLFIILGGLTCFVISQFTLANSAKQCSSNIPTHTKFLVNDNPDSFSVYIQANKAQVNCLEQMILFSGNVKIKQDNSILNADQVQLNQKQKKNSESVRTIVAIDNVSYINDDIKLKGRKAWLNLNTKDIYIEQGSYQLIGRQGHGNADTIKQRGNNYYTILKNGSFTTCPLGDNTWSIVGSEIIHDRQKQVIKIRKARFKIGKTPVFYSPYLQILVGDVCRSGFLSPNLAYGNNSGFKFSAPYYLKLSSKYDVTITPSYMSKRGIQIQTKSRYLTESRKGLIELNWLPNDWNYNYDYSNNSANRWLLYWRYNEIMKMWHFNINYAKASDIVYPNDLDLKYNSTDGYIMRKFNFGYVDENWDAALSCKKIQSFYTNNFNYCSVPQFDLAYYKNSIGPFDFKMIGQAVRFTNGNKHYPRAVRFHIEPIVNFPLVNHLGQLNVEVKIMSTHYQQKNIDYYNKHDSTGYHLDDFVNRTLPQFKTNGKMIFKRNIDHCPGYTQTLEPQLQYLYIPYCNQNNIGVYDSTILKTNYTRLFQGYPYSGLDRIPSADQLVSGVVTRIYDEKNVERFNVSIGQIYHFSQPRTNDINLIKDKYNNTDNVAWTGDSFWKINSQLNVRSNLQCDTCLHNIEFSDFVLQYRCNEDRILQLDYYYVSSLYLKKILPNVTRAYQQSISQIGIIGSWSLDNFWSLTGKYYYNTAINQPVNQLINLQYRTCCWTMNAGFERKITNCNNSSTVSKYEKKMSFNIELRGLTKNLDQRTNKMFL